MGNLSRFGGYLFCIAATITSLTGCNSSAISSSMPSTRTDATAPLATYAMFIRNDVYISSAGPEIFFDPSDEVCMLKAPDYNGVHNGETWRGNITPKTGGDCAGRVASFNLYFSGYSIAADAWADWKKPSAETWKVVIKRENGLCIDVNPKNALDVTIIAKPESGCSH